ncbi:MAG: hypothetical protein NVS3B23_09710 [Candidatus Saccharimonadales bacterium]
MIFILNDRFHKYHLKILILLIFILPPAFGLIYADKLQRNYNRLLKTQIINNSQKNTTLQKRTIYTNFVKPLPVIKYTQGVENNLNSTHTFDITKNDSNDDLTRYNQRIKKIKNNVLELYSIKH